MSDGEIVGLHVATLEPVRVQWRAGKIVDVTSHTAPAEKVFLAPPLLDVQVNGYGGVDFQCNNLSLDDLLNATRQLLHRNGCTRFFLTETTDEWSRMLARLKHLVELRGQSPELQAAITSWRMEGAVLVPEPGFHGAHNPACMKNPTPELIQELPISSAAAAADRGPGASGRHQKPFASRRGARDQSQPRSYQCFGAHAPRGG